MKVNQSLNLLCIVLCMVQLLQPSYSLCQNNCALCNPIGSGNCTLCSSPRYLFNNNCVTNCPDGYFKNTILVRACLPCNDDCLTCDGGLAWNCDSCQAPRYLTKYRTCDFNCPNDQYKSPSSQVCLDCHSSCGTCSTGGPTGCTSCFGSLALNPDNSCKTTCPDHYYKNSTSHTCIQCDASCGNCSGPATNCTSCPDEHYFYNSSDNTCTPCDSTCDTCSGAGPNACLTCAAGTPNFVPSTNSCVAAGSCPPGTYDDGSSSCPNCDASCETCSGAGNQSCTSCNGTYLYSGNNSCVASCPGGTHENATTFTCDPDGCHPSCANCTGPGADECTECNTGFPIPIGGFCFTQCSGHYIRNQFVCTSCDASCNGCTLAAENCLQCATTFVRNLTTGLCVPSRRGLRNLEQEE